MYVCVCVQHFAANKRVNESISPGGAVQGGTGGGEREVGRARRANEQ